MKGFRNKLVLIVALVIVMSSVVLAESTFSDVKAKDWYYKTVIELANRGGIAGYQDGTFKPNNTITFSEFLKMSMSSATKKEYPAQAGQHWATGVYEEAIRQGIIDGKEFPGVRDVLDKPIIREDMALILLNINIKIQGEANVDTSKTAGKIKDFDKVSANRKAHILQAYEKGLIAGKPGIGVDSKNTTTRAEASAVLMRMLDKEFRVDPNKPVETPATGAREIKAGQGISKPRVGDIFIKKDGTKVVLERGAGEILGANQGVDLFTGITFKDGTKFKHGDLGELSMEDEERGASYLGSPYYVSNLNGEGHFRGDWSKIASALMSEAPSPEGFNVGDRYKTFLVVEQGPNGKAWVVETPGENTPQN